MAMYIPMYDISTLVCLHFGAWDNSKEWSTALPEKEIIKVYILDLY